MLEVDRTLRSDQLLTMTLPNQQLDVGQVTQQIRRLLKIG
jgi:sporulation-control protein